jgi:hypothetical protein
MILVDAVENAYTALAADPQIVTPTP